jgi:hypothetical protein
VDTLFRIHSDLRWLVVLIGLLALIRLAVGYFGHHGYDRASRVLMSLFTISLELQATIGLIYLIWDGAKNDFWPRYRFEHLVIMVVAVVIAHLPKRWQSAPDSLRYRNDLAVVLCTLILIFVGVMVLIGGSNRWTLDF